MIAVFDIGGTSTKYGILEETKNTCAFRMQGEIDSDAKRLKGVGIQDTIIRLISSLQKDYPIDGIAISTAGIVDAQAGVILYANDNIPNYTGMQLKANFEAQFHIPCWVENDVNAAALGEASYGAGQNMQSMLMITIGTGIGGAMIMDKKVYRGYSGSAGEIGYMSVDNQVFQDIASTSSLVRQVELVTKEKGLNGRIIFARASRGDELCIQKIDEMCSFIVKGIHNCVCMMNPQMVVLGGGIMSQQAILAPIIDKYMKQYMQEEMRLHTQLAFAKLANQAGMMGAYAYYKQKEGDLNA